MISRRKLMMGIAALTATISLPAFGHHTGSSAAARARRARNYVVPRKWRPRNVRYKSNYPVGTILVDQDKFYLYLITRKNRARRYGVGLGRAGLEFRGGATISRKAKWPSWTPTANMIRREPKRYARFANGLPGGPNNPLGARAMYLYRNGRDTYFRIHGTTEPWTIGSNISSGCIRLVNDHVEDLYDRVKVGARVIVI